MLDKGSLSSIYDEAKVAELERASELKGKEQRKLETMLENYPTYLSILDTLRASSSEQVYKSLVEFLPVLKDILSDVIKDKKTIDKIAEGLSAMDKRAEVQRDKKGNIIYDKDTKDTEKLKLCDDIEEYMKREVLPYTPDAEAFFEEKVDVKNPVLKTGAEIIFTRQFYIPSFPEPSSEIEKEFRSLSTNIADMILDLYK